MSIQKAEKPAKAPEIISAPGVSPSAEPVDLFWYRGENFGDALSPLIVSHVAGRPVRHAGVPKAQIVALGSLMGWVRDAFHDGVPEGARPIIWGTGCLKPLDLKFTKNIEVRALRGPFSGALLHTLPRQPYGDPGVLTDELLDVRPKATGKIGVIPHWKRIDEPALAAAIKDNSDIVLIDVRTHDAMAVVRQIAQCRYVLSSSLHGLIVADSLGIPNTWLDPRGNHKFPELKFHDYAASVGRIMGDPVDLADLGAFLRGALPRTVAYAEGVAASKEALRDAFPAELRAAATAAAPH